MDWTPSWNLLDIDLHRFDITDLLQTEEEDVGLLEIYSNIIDMHEAYCVNDDFRSIVDTGRIRGIAHAVDARNVHDVASILAHLLALSATGSSPERMCSREYRVLRSPIMKDADGITAEISKELGPKTFRGKKGKTAAAKVPCFGILPEGIKANFSFSMGEFLLILLLEINCNTLMSPLLNLAPNWRA